MKMPSFIRKPAFLKIPTFDIPKLTKKRSDLAGLPPGTPVYVGEERHGPVTISVINYSKETLEEKEITDIGQCFDYVNRPDVTWINVNGIHDSKIISQIGEMFKLHPLVLEDIMNTQQRPKMEDFDDTLFLVLKMMYYVEKEKDIRSEHIAMVLGKDFLITFQERPGDIFDMIRNRIRSGKGRIRSMGNDYLAYSLIDAIVDNYFVILEQVGESVEEIEEQLMDRPDPETLHQIYFLKREMIFLRKSVWPLREILAALERLESPLIQPATGRYIRDVYDHTIQVIDMVETYRDMLSGMLDLYLSSISNKMNELSIKMNEVMKVLTIIATIFIPLTFIAGLYGMNFNPSAGPWNMPELGWEYGYLASILSMVIVALLMVIYFRKKKWL